MIVEFFGLSNTGKSVLKEKLSSKGHKVFTTRFDEKIGRKVGVRETSRFWKILYFFKYFLGHPIKTKFLFFMLNGNHIDVNNFHTKFKIFLMRNSYLVSVLSKFEHIKNTNKEVFTDEFSFQSIFMIFHKKADEKEIRKVINSLPRSKYLFLFEGERKRRHAVYRKSHQFKKGATLLPGSWIDKGFAKTWMDSMEYNFEIVKKVIPDFYDINGGFKELNPGNITVYVKK